MVVNDDNIWKDVAIYNCRVYASVVNGEQHADAINPVYEANSNDTYVSEFAQWWADWSNYSSENGVSLQIAVFIYSRTAVFISTFYSRKSELFLKKGGVILSGLATDSIVLFPALELNQFYRSQLHVLLQNLCTAAADICTIIWC